jgi:Zn-finger nucleic acid-binding protein
MIKINPAWTLDEFSSFDTCPECLGELEAIAHEDDVDFYCPACRAYWHLSMGCLTKSTGRDRPAARG